MSSLFEKVSQFYNQLLSGETNFADIDLSKTSLERLMITQPCNFTNASFEGVDLFKAHLSQLLMDGANFTKANLSQARLKNGSCQNTIFHAANLTQANFTKTSLINAIFTGANLSQCNFQEADLRGANFKGVDITQASFEGALYSDKTIFDADVHPKDFGMLKEGKIASPEKVTSQEKIYRGQLVIAEEASPTETEPAMKVMYYRGVKTLVEAKTAQPKQHKKQLTYRGIPIE